MASSMGISHSELAAKLRGQKIHVPNLLNRFPGWPSGDRNKEYERLRDAFNGIIDR